MGHGLFSAGFSPGFSTAFAFPKAAAISSPATAPFLGLQADPSGAIVSGPLSPSFDNWLLGPVSWFAGVTEGYVPRQKSGEGDWRATKEGVTQVIQEVLTRYLDNDPDRISTNKIFRTQPLLLASGNKVNGNHIFFAVARLERPSARTVDAAVKELGGYGPLIRILKRKYLGLPVEDAVPIDLATPQAITKVVQEILAEHLDGDPHGISASFRARSLPLASGGTVSGDQVLRAVARLERPTMENGNAAIRELGGHACVTDILKEKYLGIERKEVISVNLATAEDVTQILQEILAKHLNNDPELISWGQFQRQVFGLESGGEVSGQRILSAVVRLEKPGMSVLPAIRELGGYSAVITLLKKKYLHWKSWSESAEGIREVVREILRTDLGNDPDRISTTHFLRVNFSLTSGIDVTGRQILFAVAGMERPAAKSREAAIKELGGNAAVIEILKKKYLQLDHWWESSEGIRQVTQGILRQYLDDDPDRISTSAEFYRRSYPLVSGGKASGQEIVHAVARLERPGAKTVVDATAELGGLAAVIRILKRKYLGLTHFSEATPSEMEAFIQEKGLSDLVHLFGDDPSKLVEALSFLKEDVFRDYDVAEFVKTLVGLKIGRKPESDRPYGGKNDEEARRRYLAALQKALESGETVDLSQRNLGRQADLLIRMSRRSFETDPGALIDELRDAASRVPDHLTREARDFLRGLYGRVADHFGRTLDFRVRGLKTIPYGYEREGAAFLATRDRAILADEAGMGKSLQVIAAVEVLGLKRVLWVTTASNRATLRGEILEHSKRKASEILEIVSGYPSARAKQIRKLRDERYVLINYENLREIQSQDPEGYAKLTEGLDAVIVDEAQLTDNPEALRTKAIHDIEVQRRWLLTATPYQSKLRQMWSLLNWVDPEKYPDERAFRELYTESTQGLLMLRSELDGILLRRTKRDTLGFFRPLAEISFEEQLQDGLPRLPRLERIPPEVRGGYELTWEQAELIARMTADFAGWAASFNADLPQGAEPVDLAKINPLQKLETIRKAIYEPESFGLETANPLWDALDRTVDRRMRRREKVILWAWNTSLLDEMEKRYASHGIRRIDGMVRGPARESARGDFQQNADIMILTANYLSGGVGLTLTAAHADIFVQLPMAFPLLYQASGRKQRLIGLNNLRYAKDRVEEEWMVPRFPKGFVDGLKDESLAEILRHGTLVEQVRRRLEGGEYLYNMVMDGYGNPEDLEKYFRVGLLEGMGLV